METTDVLILGAGPIGIELAVALRQAGLPYLHLEAGQIGATIAWYAPATRFFSSPERIAIAGVPFNTQDQSKATREEYLTYLRSVVQQFDLEIRTYRRATRIERLPDGSFELSAQSSHQPADTVERYRCRRLVLAIGDLHGPRRLSIPGEDLPHVSHYLADPHTYFRQKGLIVGGKNSAVEAAIRCFRVGSRVTLSYRGPEFNPDRIKFWLLPEIRSLCRDDRVHFLPATVPRQILPDRVLLERLDPATGAPGETLEVPADFVLLLTGYQQDPTLFQQLGIQLDGPGLKPHFDEQTMETNVPNLYIAGTASAGTQLGGVTTFIETCHVHVQRIVAALTGGSTKELAAPEYELEES